MSIPIRGLARGTAQLAYTIARQRNPDLPAFTLDYFIALYADAAARTVNADILVAQWDLETDRGRDTDWTEDKNPAGMAIFPDGSSWGLTFTPATAARAQVTHICRYLDDDVPADWIALDARWDVPEMRAMVGTVTNVEDLGNGRWATDPNYASKLIGRYESYWGPYVPVTNGGGSVVVTKPRIIDKWLHVTQDGYTGVVRYIPNRNGNRARIIVIHVQEGNNWGSWEHFHAVSASATVLIGKNGDVWRLVPEQHGPWTNGDVKSPDAFMVSVMNRWGWDPNAYSLTIECEGNSGGLPYTAAQRNAIYWQVNDWVSRYAIDAIYIVGHGQINSIDRYYCPEKPDASGKRPFVEAIRAQAGGAPVIEVPTTVYRDPWPVKTDAGVLWDGKADITVTTGPSPVTFYADKGTKTVDADLLYGRQWASTTATFTNRDKRSGQTIDALGWVEGEEVDGERRWWVARDGTRYWSGGTKETPSKQAPVPETPDDPGSNPDYGNIIDKIPVVLNGNVYYPFEDRQGDAGVGRQMVAVEDGPLYTWADPRSAARGTIAKGQKRFAAYWVRGVKIGDEDLWYVLDDGSKDPVKTGPRIWAGLMAERPD
ncbi:MAG: peptidoglycan recognition family protein [Thermomicrobiales bacterium]